MFSKSNMLVIPVDQHGLTKNCMDQDALAILRELENAGYQAFLVGGCIRDLIVGKVPKDTDIVTNAKPHQIKKVLPKSILIGRRFPLVHVRVPGKKYKIIEVATFRTRFADYKPRFRFIRWLMHFFIYGNLEQDAFRRDITVQSLYWRAKDEAIIDYHGGYQHAKMAQIHIIGDPVKRFQEDPVRILRVLRVMAKLGFTIDKVVHDAINSSKSLITTVSDSRMFIEVVRSLHGGFGVSFYKVLKKYKMNNLLFASVVNSKEADAWVLHGLLEADRRYSSGMSLSSGYLFAVLLWPSYKRLAFKAGRYNKKLAHKIILSQSKITNLPKRNIQMIEAIWRLQGLIASTSDVDKAKSLSKVPYFKAAYDFFLLRASLSSDLNDILNKWLQLTGTTEQVEKQ